jgi:putative alpha-1,2-mannosidase
MSEMAAAKFGQYAHSNQPVHHVLYVFAAAGRPDRTQFWARRVMQELYTKDTFAGDEDTGSMAAWYVLSSLGLYSACPGRPDYTLGSPLFARATVHLPEGKDLLIEAKQNSPTNVFVRRVAFNGASHTGTTIAHSDIVQGGKLAFEMSAERA